MDNGPLNICCRRDVRLGFTNLLIDLSTFGDIRILNQHAVVQKMIYSAMAVVEVKG